MPIRLWRWQMPYMSPPTTCSAWPMTHAHLARARGPAHPRQWARRRRRMDDDALDDLVRRLTALIVKIDERDSHMVERLDALQTMLEEQRAFNQEQVRINTRLETLMRE